jgi:acetylornithine deacetylase/succinyl-diaminopimelate desuccinylase-like protein
MLPGTDLLGSGTAADMLWSRPAVTVLGIDCPPVVGSTPAIPAQARAPVNLRVPPGMDPQHAQDALIAHLHAATPGTPAWRSSTWPSPRHYSSPTIPRERRSQPTEAAAPHMTRLALAASLV